MCEKIAVQTKELLLPLCVEFGPLTLLWWAKMNIEISSDLYLNVSLLFQLSGIKEKYTI